MNIGSGRIAAMASTLALVLLGATALVEHGGSAAADSSPSVVVHGTDFPDPARAGLSLVGCASMYDVAPETPQPMIGQGPGDAPLGARSLAYDLTGGNGIGPAFRVDSIASVTTASVSVHPWVSAATGVAYAAYLDPSDPDALWVGRTSLSAPGGGWTTIDVAGRAFDWVRYDATSMEITDQGSGVAEPIGDFTDQHGDGPGVVTFGFGCNGVPFNLDALRIADSDGSVTYDLEGLTTAVGMSRSDVVTPSGETTLHGALRTGDGAPLAGGATLRLERADAPDGPWRAVGAFPVEDGVATATVHPGQRTWYRWEFVDRPLASGSTSTVAMVDGTDAADDDNEEASATPGPSSRATPTERPSSTPTQPPSEGPSQDPSDEPSREPSNEPTVEATPSATATPSRQPTGPTDAPSPEPTGRAGESDGPASASTAPSDAVSDSEGPSAS